MDSTFSGFVEPALFAAQARPCRGADSLRAVALTAVLALPACVGYAPDPLRPQEALQQLVQRAGHDVTTEAAGPWQAEWFPLAPEVRIADGLTLGEANTLALFYGPVVRSARGEASIAGAQVLQAGVLSNPQLFLGPRISTEDSSLIFPASIAWNLPIWGVESAQRGIAEARLTKDLLRVVEVELDALLQVRAHFVRIRRLQHEETVLAAVAASSRQIVNWVEALARAGEADDVAVYLARTERDEAATALEDVRAAVRREHRELFGLLGMLPDAQVTFVVDAAAAAVPELPAADRTALLAVPTLRAAEAAYAEAEAALRFEVSRQYPRIQFGPEFENDRGDPSLGLGIAIDLPLFDRNKGGIAAGMAARQRAREAYDATLLQSAHAEADARDALESVQRQLQIHREGAWRDAEQASRALEVRLRAGRAQVVEVLTAQRAIARARSRMLELDEQATVARLRAAVAGGLALQRPTAITDKGDKGTER